MNNENQTENIADKPVDESRRPWGFYDILSDKETYKVKSITVYPHKRLSLQSHQLRQEHWYIVHGRAKVTLGERLLELKPGETVDIHRGAKHRIENIGDDHLVFIEIQTGDYFGEDDIKRYEDDFNRI